LSKSIVDTTHSLLITCAKWICAKQNTRTEQHPVLQQSCCSSITTVTT